ncbi:hypothetical protein [Pseudomonas sp. NFPP28]|uniref:hypothetical protein n=1 Tax=Pseudomonas sp. NFPP28 TaxID=1566231 RepID=UPI0008EE34E6|nr:hypothetical protein [Pseudomonas sp. NFPP28]SFO76240.1 hypothetical protein SAMN03159315_00081 [Pseudomonas sp. NFPP28]
MSDLLNDSPQALQWLEEAERRHSSGAFGTIARSIIWSDARSEDGELLLDLNPHELVTSVNEAPFTLLHNHDPGQPKGEVLESAYFQTASGRAFVAAILGYYFGGNILSFRDLKLDFTSPARPPLNLPDLPGDVRIEIAADPRDVENTWLDEATSDAPVRIKRTALSHNGDGSSHQLILIGIAFALLVGKPFVTAFASEAGKDSYFAIRGWIRKLLSRIADRHNPILDFHSHHDGCQVSFIFRGKDVKKLYQAHDALSDAASQAALLVSRLKAMGLPSRQLVYEFDKEDLQWAPSFAVLEDDRILTDNLALISIEHLPDQLSLGLTKKKSLVSDSKNKINPKI